MVEYMNKNEDQFKSHYTPSDFGNIWTNESPSSKFIVRHPEKPGEYLLNPTGQLNPEHWVPMALDLERRREKMKSEEDDN